MRVIAIDPGESIGIVFKHEKEIIGQTISGEDRNSKLWNYLSLGDPQVVVYEEFKLRQGAATKLVGNKFITCEVIGVIKLYCQLNRCVLIPLPPYTKEYCGFGREPSNTAYEAVHTTQKITEHVRDAYRLLKYAELFCEGVQQ